MELNDILDELLSIKMRLHDIGNALDEHELFGVGDAIGDAFDFVDRAEHLLEVKMGTTDDDDVDDFEITGRRAKDD